MTGTAPLGRRFAARPARVAAIAIGALTVTADAAIVSGGRSWDASLRLSVAGAAALLLLLVARGDRATLGLTLVPVQGWRAWLRITAVIAALLGAVLAVVTLGLGLAGMLHDPPTLSPQDFGPRVVWACLWTPPFEEGVYRLALCAPLAALPFGRAPVVALSGVAFALLHVGYGNPAPDNLLAGFVLGWAYLHSGCVLVPIALHALGNLFALSAQLVTWHLTSG